jgi:signal transduction histidine kinase
MGNGVKKEGVEYLDTVRSHYVVPISTGEFENEVDAVFSMSSEFEDFFSTERRKIIDDFVTQTSLAIGKDLLRKKRQEVHRDYSMSSQLLVQISEQLKGENILENIYDIVAQGIVDIVNPELVSIFLFNERTNKLEKVAERIANNPQRNLNETYSPGESLTGTVFARGETIRLNNDPTHHPNYSPSSEERDVLKLASGRLVHYLGVPLVDGSKIVGVIRVINKRSEYYDEPRERPRRNDEIDLLKRGFSQDSQTVLTIIASHLSVAIKNAELVNRLSGRINQLETLSDVARRVSSNYGVEIDDLLDLIVRKTAEVTNSSICMLFLRDEHERDRIVLKQVYGIPKLEGIYYKIGEGKIGHAAASGTSILEKSADKSHRGKYDDLIRKALRNEEGKDEIESFMAAPIVVEDMSRISGEDIIGVLQVINKKDDHRHFDEDDLHVFKTFASQIGVALALAERTYALSQLVGGVCHEINNTSPLIPPTVKKIKQLLGTIDGEVEKRLDRIDALARQTVEFANDLLGFSGSALQEKKSVDINELVKSALEYISPDTVSIENYHTVTLVLQLSEHPIRCNVYPTPFIHIIRNIIVNAYHATEEKEQGCIIIRTYLDPTGQTAYLEFVDNGRGIKREHLSKIFSPDFSTKKGVKGNGLGLWMVKTYLSRMGGTIAVRSEVGQGATFTIRIRAIIGVN